MKIDKFQASGNDFLVINNYRETSFAALRDTALRVCDRHFGLGSDGVLFLTPLEQGRYQFRIWNNNGSEAEISGNGLIIAGAYAFSRTPPPPEGQVIFETKAGRREVKLLKEEGHIRWIRVNMGQPRFHSDEIPFCDGINYQKIVDYPLSINQRMYNITVLSMGNPHAVVFMENFPSSFELQQIGKEIEVHPFFPNHTNVEFVKVLNPQTVEVLFWERGVGETLSSGSGSSAAAVASQMKGFTGKKVKVKTRAGDISIETVDETVYLEGYAQHIFSGEFFEGNATAG